MGNQNEASAGEALAGCLMALATLAATVLVLGWILLVLWNVVVPGAFGLAAISYPQALGLTALLSFVSAFFRSGK